MIRLTQITRPGLMVSQVSPASRIREGETLRILESALSLDFFQAFQTVEVPYPAERKKIAQRVKEKYVLMTYCLARFIYKNKLNLASMDIPVREKSVARIIMGLEDAREQGAHFVQLISGPAPSNPEKRNDALLCLKESLFLICEAAASEPKLTVLIEPLDVLVHKKGALGYTGEAVELAAVLRKGHGNIGLCLDTAHMILNGEDIMESLKSAMDCTNEFHFCNCVTDSNHPLYGDHHIPFGPPGVLDVEGIADILVRGYQIGFFAEEVRPSIFCEAINKTDDVEKSIRYYIHILRSAEEIGQTKLESGI